MKYHIQAAWNQFRTVAMLPNTPPIQAKEMRAAFYAGVASILEKIMVTLTDSEEVQPEDVQMMADIHDELHEFAAEFERSA